MSVSRPLLLGLGGLALLGVVQWVILPAFEYRADNASRAERARQRHLSMQLLTDDYALLSTVALLAVRVSGDSLTQLAETGWEDGVLRAGRGKMIQMLRESPDSLDQWGTLSPEYPDVEWHSKLIALRCMEGKRLEFRLVENRGTSSRELLLEYILPR